MPDPKFTRRPEYDDLVQGWGSDNLDDLVARCELLGEWWSKHFPLTDAELKIARAINKRLVSPGGLELPMVN